MKQILQSYRDGKLWLADVPAPACPERGVLVRTRRSVISAGTERMLVELARKSIVGKALDRPDLVRKVIRKVRSEGLAAAWEKVFAKLDTPIPLGYSCVGEVIEAGPMVQGLPRGTRVACAGVGYANHAEVNAVPVNLCVPVPAGVTDEDAAFTTIGAIAVQGVRQAQVQFGEAVCVIGLGLIGQLTVQILKAAGCRVFGYDPSVERCQLARSLGAEDATHTELPARAVAFSRGRGLDAVIIAAGAKSNEPVEDAVAISRLRGRVVIVGAVRADIPRDDAYRKELDIRFSMSYGPGRYDPDYEEGGHDYPFAHVRWTEQRNMEAFLDLVAAGQVVPSALISQRLPLDQAAEAYDMLTSNGHQTLAILLEYTAGPEEPLLHRTIERRSEPLGAGGVGISFIGAGNFGTSVLMPAFRRAEGVALRAVCSARGVSGTQAAAKFGFTTATTDVARVLGDTDTSAVVIATRHDSHAGLVCKALDAGKHVFCEKPLALAEDELAEVQAAAARHPDRLLQVGFNRRFSAHAMAVRAFVEEGGAPPTILYRVRAGAVPAGSWVTNPESGGDRIVGEMCHFVDLCGFLSGAPVRSVTAAHTGAGGDASVSATLAYANGAVAVVQYVVDGSVSLPKEYVEVSCAGRTAVIDNFERTRFHGCDRVGVKGTDKGFDAEVGAFVRALRAGGAAPIALESLAETTRVTFEIRARVRNA